MTTDELILVTGGTGKTGRRVSQRLVDLGVPVRVGSRSGEPAFDWTDRATWPATLAGASAAYVSFQPDLAVPGAAETIEAFARLAVESGVQRLVMLSGRGEREAEQAEKALAASGADWTVVRASWFAQNFGEGAFVDDLRAGVLALPVGAEIREPFIDADDIADVAVAALTDARLVGQLYEVTGPRLLTFGDVVSEIGTATGRDLVFQEVPMPDFLAALRDLQLPDDALWLLDYLFSEIFDGRNASVADGVQRALGRAPRDFADYARKAAATGVWGR
ncbi:MAG: NAD(P)H-binding protein [Actinomycetota bacterium]|nr:NAD(P)H-binding protein [Actinomycetota bacterium]